MSRWLVVAAFFGAAFFSSFRALAQADAVVLVAKPELDDPNFAQSVVLVTHTAGGETVGVVLNRPTRLSLAEVAPKLPHASDYAGTVYAGGPVLRQVIVALFHSPETPAAAAFRVLDGTWLTLHPKNIEPLLAARRADVRLFSGFCGWAPGQLEAEIARDSWYVVPATEEVLFRGDTSQLWRELIDRLQNRRTLYLVG
jgi:putative transcriptional regulator